MSNMSFLGVSALLVLVELVVAAMNNPAEQLLCQKASVALDLDPARAQAALTHVWYR